MIKGIISTGSYIIKLLINIYEKFYKSTAAVREEVYIGVFHRKILIFAWMFSRINSVILGGINMSEITVIALDAMPPRPAARHSPTWAGIMHRVKW